METTPGVEPNGGQKGQAWVHAHARAFLWSVDSSLLDLDDADHRWAAEKSLGDWETEPPSQGTALLGGRRERPRSLPTDVVFLSKHLAKSGVPALCVHPIGLPDVSIGGCKFDSICCVGRTRSQLFVHLVERRWVLWE